MSSSSSRSRWVNPDIEKNRVIRDLHAHSKKVGPGPESGLNLITGELRKKEAKAEGKLLKGIEADKDSDKEKKKKTLAAANTFTNADRGQGTRLGSPSLTSFRRLTP